MLNKELTGFYTVPPIYSTMHVWFEFVNPVADILLEPIAALLWLANDSLDWNSMSFFLTGSLDIVDVAGAIVDVGGD